MTPALFTPFTLKGITFKNRIVMSPMCMYSCFAGDGKITPWHITHYASRAVGQVALVMTEATAVIPNGRISYEDLGIWDDAHIDGLRNVVSRVHDEHCLAGIQLAHAGRKAQLKEKIVAPSALPFEGMSMPAELTAAAIKEIVNAFREAAQRAKTAGFDVIELHAAHGYLVHEFLSPLSNQRTDAYGGSVDKRYTFLQEIIDAVRQVWTGPLFVRISATEYAEGGNTPDVYAAYAQRMKAQGVDLIDCSSGGIVPAKINAFPGYQVPAAAQIRQEASIATGAVGLITDPVHADKIIQEGHADLIFLARALLRNPYWAYAAATTLNTAIPAPKQYLRGWQGMTS